MLALAGVGAAAGDPVPPVCAPGEFAADAGCTPSRDDREQAQSTFNQGLKLSGKGKLEQAFDTYSHASRLVPTHPEYVSAREIARQQLVLQHIQRGNLYLADNRQVQALAEFRGAVELDPQNEFAQQRLRDAAGDDAPQGPAVLRLVEQSEEIELRPHPGKRDFQYRGDTRGLIEEIGRAFGVSVIFDASFSPRLIKFKAEGLDFAGAMRVAGRLAKSFWTPLADNQVLVASETSENRRQFDQMSVRTYYVSGATSAQELNVIVSVFRSLFDIRFVSAQPTKWLITVRGPKRLLDAAARFMEQTAGGRPQVLLDIKAYEINRTLLRNIGVDLPLQFRIFNIPAAALLAGSGGNIQDLINQLIASGGINQASSGAIAALLAQLQGQQNSLFAQPVVTFGKGLTLTGIGVPPATAKLAFNESQVRVLQHVTLRAADGTEAIFRVGSRFPIINASFAPILNSPALSQVIQNQSFRTPFPSFTFQDLGITVKATPHVHGNSDVTLKLDTQIKALAGPSFNGVPVLSNREYTGMITLKNGETAMVIGSISSAEQRSLAGLPGAALIPGLSRLTGSTGREVSDSELLVVITPHVLSPASGVARAEIWMDGSK